jgi:hypothetical protein
MVHICLDIMVLKIAHLIKYRLYIVRVLQRRKIKNNMCMPLRNATLLLYLRHVFLLTQVCMERRNTIPGL